MPTYEFRCHECAVTFDVQRPTSASSDPAICPDGHPNQSASPEFNASVASQRTLRMSG
ncbi:FmdB family zinc ribbon protein [Actinophytocola sp.]|uniref:FmdB family zinc ribbon protein n=1 Tax=Actinophytocola sp. TaxID=1872138 RepID=UPI003D6B0954